MQIESGINEAEEILPDPHRLGAHPTTWPHHRDPRRMPPGKTHQISGRAGEKQHYAKESKKYSSCFIQIAFFELIPFIYFRLITGHNFSPTG